MADRGARAAKRKARRNGPVENATVDITGNVDNQIDVDSDSLSDNELLEEVIRAVWEGETTGNGSWVMAKHG